MTTLQRTTTGFRPQSRGAVALLLSLGLHGAALVALLAWQEPKKTETVMIVELIADWADSAGINQSRAEPVDPPREPAPPIALPREPPRAILRNEAVETANPEQQTGQEPPTAPEPEQIAARNETPKAVPVLPESKPEPVTEPAHDSEPDSSAVPTPLDLSAVMPAPAVAPPTRASATRGQRKHQGIAAVPPVPPPPRGDMPAPETSVSPPIAGGTTSPVPAPAAEPPSAPSIDLDEAPRTSADRSARSTSERLPDSYRRALFRWLERHKIYPPAARQSRIEGRVLLRVRIERSGRVTMATITEPSGHTILDEAALDMVRRAGDAPSLPDEFPADQAEIVAPLVFSLK